MRILFLGDVFGRSGRDAIAKYLPTLKQKYEPDFTIVNGENAAHGFGIMPDMAKDFFHLGIDVITGGNHSFDKNEIITLMSQSDKVLRPLNYPKNVPGKGGSNSKQSAAPKPTTTQAAGTNTRTPFPKG